MTTIALFGATGKTGRRVLHRALDAGYDVRALVRDPDALDVQHERLTVIRGDVLDPAAVDSAVAGSDVVLSLFGQVKGSPKTLQADGTRNIVRAMQAHGVRRIVTLSGGGLRAGDKDRPKAPDHVMRFLLKTLAGHVLADAEAHLDVLRESGLDWTVVRGPRLLETPGAGTYRVGWVGVGTGMQISRDDLADFIVTQVDDRSFVHEMPFVSA
ncbi:NAD(P)H-binding protein [Agromyces sp. CFH 90414]|uniref:NAD(P)H-binding protein n=1 Tax=Agromyces agglutinans TaxID=2662258 RepID=A0A6I2F7Z2_9MICO|nr:SDR family oxidoreductase [Agromyces agglutinans]MRG60729.1 NAD(P)H-binding protein [Agromyces agglutinans]